MMRHALATLAVTAALALPAAAAAEPLDLSNMSPSDRAAFGEQVRTYILEHPEVIFDAIQVLEQRRNEAAAQNDKQLVAANHDTIYDDGYSWVGGNPDGDVTLVEFMDYRCGYCKKAQPEIEALMKADPKIRLIIKEFPILGPDSVKAGKMALAALELDREKFGTLHEKMMSYRGNLTEQVAYRIAGDAGYDVDNLRKLAESDKIEERVQKNYQLAERLGIQGTPGFIIGSEIIRGYLPAQDLLSAVKDARVVQN